MVKFLHITVRIGCHILTYMKLRKTGDIWIRGKGKKKEEKERETEKERQRKRDRERERHIIK